MKLIDVSEHNGVLNWDAIDAAVKSGELGGVIIRAGYGTATGVQRDAQFIKNRDQARAKGIPRQFYMFAYPGRSGGNIQAQGMAAIVGQLQAGESISLDMEDEPTYGRTLTVADVDWALNFCLNIRDILGVKPLVYMNSNVLSRFDWSKVVSQDFGLWIANYGKNNGQPNGDGPASDEWPFWAVWQYTSKASIAGISPVDANVFNGDAAAFLKYGAGKDAPIPAAPIPAPSPVSGLGTSYIVRTTVPGYYTAADAQAGRSQAGQVAPGAYFVFNQAMGMVNVTSKPGVPGSWINPANNTQTAATPAAPSGNYQLVVDVPGYVNAGDAAARKNSNSTAKAGGYFVFNTYNGMVNVTTKPGVPGYWINPGDNKPGGNSAPPVSPAPAIYTVVPKDSVDSISRAFGLSTANNYAQYRALNPYSGHNGDWTNIWPGDKVRVR